MSRWAMAVKLRFVGLSWVTMGYGGSAKLGSDQSGFGEFSLVTAVEFGWREFKSVMICSVSAVNLGCVSVR